MSYTAEQRAAKVEVAKTNGNGIQELTQALLDALRGAMQPPIAEKVEVVTVGQTSEAKLDRLIFCPDCLGRDGPAWGTHMIYWLAADPTRPGQVKRVEVPHAHPQVKKTLSYDAISVREGLKEGTHGKQCIQCGAKLGVAV